MKKTIIFLCLLAINIVVYAQDREEEYIKKYARIAVEEMQKYNIPASITLAQGILETGGGQSRLAEQANNHFGIKCKKEWTGQTITHDDDARGECFRKYNSARESYEDHSKFLAYRPYYKNLFKLRMTDYKAWAHGLKRAGYATNPRYAQILISKIEKHHLYNFDKITPEEVNHELASMYGASAIPEEETVIAAATPETPTAPEVISPVKETPTPPKPKKPVVRRLTPKQRIKRHPIGREYVVVLKGETINSLSKMYHVSPKKLLKNNELKSASALREGQYLFFNKKKSKGAKEKYVVKKWDNMYVISQKNGIKLKKLYQRNRMKQGQEPKVGTVLYLRGKKPRK